MYPDYIIKADPYPVSVLVFTTIKGWDEFLDNINMEIPVKGCLGKVSNLAHESGDEMFIMYLPKKASLLTIVHECLHLAYYALDYAGVKHDSYNHEALTYLQTHLIEQVLENRRNK